MMMAALVKRAQRSGDELIELADGLVVPIRPTR
jgi:hypothetical protein